MHIIDLKDLTFESVLSLKSTYGIVWKALYKGKAVVAKVVMLTSGVHRDKATDTFQAPSSSPLAKVRSKDLAKYFAVDGPAPFSHTRFALRKAMEVSAFKREAVNCQKLSGMDLTPMFYGACIRSESPEHPVVYGVIVMERAEGTVKDVLVRRDLHRAEKKLIKAFIEQVHGANVAHRDFKPSNACAWYDSNGIITRVRLIDCQKIQYKDDVGSKAFKKMVRDDLDTYKRHVVRNIKERVKT